MWLWLTIALADTPLYDAISPSEEYWEQVADHRMAPVARAARAAGVASLVHRDLDGLDTVVWRDSRLFHKLRLLDGPELDVLLFVLAVEELSRAEVDVMVPVNDFWVPVSVFWGEEAVVVQGGEPVDLTLPPGPSEEQLRARYGIGPLIEDDRVWGDGSRALLDQALALLSTEELVYVADVPVARRSSASAKVREQTGLDNPGAVFSLSEEGPRIEIYDEAMRPGYRFVGPVRSPIHPALDAMLHEIGHAVAAAPLWASIRATQHQQGAFEAAVAVYNEQVAVQREAVADLQREQGAHAMLAASFNLGHDPFQPGSGLPATQAHYDELHTKLRSLQARQATLEAAGAALDEENTALEAQGASLEATYLALGEQRVQEMPAVADWALFSGADGPTPYGQTAPAESFAEAFMLYKLDPEALERVVPGAVAWFEAGRHLP